jgi:hypothetical protein
LRGGLRLELPQQPGLLLLGRRRPQGHKMLERLPPQHDEVTGLCVRGEHAVGPFGSGPGDVHEQDGQLELIRDHLYTHSQPALAVRYGIRVYLPGTVSATT